MEQKSYFCCSGRVCTEDLQVEKVTYGLKQSLRAGLSALHQ